MSRNNTKFVLKIQIFFGVCAKFSKSIQFLAHFTIGMIRNETGHFLECVELYGKLIKKSESMVV